MFSKTENFLKRLVDVVPGYVGALNTEMKFICANEAQATVFGHKNKDDILGSSYSEQPCKAAECADIFEQQSKLVLSRTEPINLLSYDCYANERWELLFGTKSVLYDDDNEVIGTLDIFHNVTDFNLLDIGRLLVNKTLVDKNDNQTFHYFLEKKDFHYDLSQRQLECLFFLLRGKTVKTIAKILGIHHRTVEAHVEQLKHKMICYSKFDLIEKAILLGYMNIIPRSLFNCDLKKRLEA